MITFFAKSLIFEALKFGLINIVFHFFVLIIILATDQRFKV